LAEGIDGAIWVGAGPELVRLNATGQQERFFNASDYWAVAAILQDQAGNTWVGKGNGLTLLKRSATDGCYRIAQSFTKRDGLPENRVFSLFETGDGQLYAGTYHGLARILRSGDGIRFAPFANQRGLGDSSINSLAEDGEHNLWLGSETSGALKLANGGFERFGTADGLIGQRNSSFFHDSGGRFCAVMREMPPKRDDLTIGCVEGDRFETGRPRLSRGSSRIWVGLAPDGFAGLLP
jgi:ligand-binding sensor domain-containing protein